MGYDETIKNMYKKLAESNILFISGLYGTGKKKVLKKIIKEFKLRKQVIYYNCNQSDRSFDFDKLLNYGIDHKIVVKISKYLKN